MSLLLNALKKAEDGEKSSAAESGQADVAAQPAASAAQPIDLDAIVEKEEEKPGKSAQPADPDSDFSSVRRRVDAARVFGASQTDGAAGGGFTKLLLTIFGLAVIGGGGYFVLTAGLIPGVDLQYIKSLLGEEEQQRVVEARVEPGAQLKVSEDIVLLPVPAVDVQSEVDFSALRLPQNSSENLDKDAYVKQIAFLTGFDIIQERTRQIQEQRELLLDLSLDGEDADADADGSGEEVVEEEERVIRTADDSREAKYSFDSATPSDKDLNEIIVNGEQPQAEISAESAESADETVEIAQTEVKIAQTEQVQVKLSSQGRERQNMIKQARSLYYSGSYLEAETIYRNVLVKSPTSRDALRGIAQIAIVTGRYQTAIAAYLDLLSYYPDDPVAIAELTNLRGDNGNFYEIEKALKNALGEMPSADGRLYFSLGNLYAQNGRIIEAQQAYFEAFNREANNPDYAYNLAVTLDYLNKPTLAARYYQNALHLAKDVPVGFNRGEVEARIRDLN